MITIVTALYCEARPFIEKYKLIRDDNIHQFQVFEGENVRLIITGTGKIQAAIAVSMILTRCTPTAEDCLINVGICAAQKLISGDKNLAEQNKAEKHHESAEQDSLSEQYEIGKILYCHSILDEETKRTYYPDMIYPHDLMEVQAVTVSRPYKPCQTEQKSIVTMQESEGSVNCIYEMEASGIYQAAEHFLQQHQMVFLKIISDDGMTELTPEMVTELIQSKVSVINQLMVHINQILKLIQENQKLAVKRTRLTEKLSKDLHCSEFMEHQLSQYLHYGLLTGAEIEKSIANMYDQGKLPCKDKKEGKLRFEQLKRCWIS